MDVILIILIVLLRLLIVHTLYSGLIYLLKNKVTYLTTIIYTLAFIGYLYYISANTLSSKPSDVLRVFLLTIILRILVSQLRK